MNLVYNIPHAGTVIPDWALEDFLISKPEIKEFTKRMVDARVDKLFGFASHRCKTVNRISRVVVDMERYRDDEKESMASLGMGLFYERDDRGKTIRVKGNTYDRCLSIYDKYHRKLESRVAEGLKTDKVLILDCHSFHDEMAFTKYSPSEFPDICIGTNDSRTDGVVNIMLDEFLRNGFTVAINMPFSGALIPEKYAEDSNVASVMIELNRRIYNNSKKDFIVVGDMLFNTCMKLRKTNF